MRNLGQQIEDLEQQIDQAAANGQDTTDLDAQLVSLEQQLMEAIQRRKTAREQEREARKAARTKGGQSADAKAAAPGQAKRTGA